MNSSYMTRIISLNSYVHHGSSMWSDIWSEMLVGALSVFTINITWFKIYLTDIHLLWYTLIMRKKSMTLLSPQDQLRYFPASVVACKATSHPLSRFDEEQEMRQRWSDLSETAHTPYLHLIHKEAVCGSWSNSFACLEESFRWMKSARKCGHADPLNVWPYSMLGCISLRTVR